MDARPRSGMEAYYKLDADKKIAQKILSYLLKHPQSKDTLEGIAQWWLEKECIEESVDMVDRGLSLLCSQGLVVEEKGVATSPYYRLNNNPKKW